MGRAESQLLSLSRVLLIKRVPLKRFNTFLNDSEDFPIRDSFERFLPDWKSLM